MSLKKKEKTISKNIQHLARFSYFDSSVCLIECTVHYCFFLVYRFVKGVRIELSVALGTVTSKYLEVQYSMLLLFFMFLPNVLIIEFLYLLQCNVYTFWYCDISNKIKNDLQQMSDETLSFNHCKRTTVMKSLRHCFQYHALFRF